MPEPAEPDEQLLQTPQELFELLDEIKQAQAAIAHARNAAAAVSDEAFEQTDRLFQFDEDSRAAVRVMLLSCALRHAAAAPSHV